MTIGQATSKRIDEYLFTRGITLYRLAHDAAIPVATLQNLYRGHTKSPTLAVIFKICDALEITAQEFLDSPFFQDLELD